jgi:hypothetical protein
MAWVLTRGLTTVRNEFNTVFPGRDKTSDGSKGDPAHAASVSGHNPDRTGRAEHRDGDALDEVRAIDLDRDLVPGSAIDWMELVVQYLVRRARAGHYIPFRYIIYKRRIWRRTDDWRTREYTGSNDHDRHAHASGDYTQTADNWTGSLGLASIRTGDDVAITPAERTAIAQETVQLLLNADLGAPGGGDTVGVALQTGAYSNTRAILGIVTTLATAVAGLDDVDETALAEALAPAVAVLVIPALVAAVEANDGAPLSEAQVKNAVKAALREGTE